MHSRGRRAIGGTHGSGRWSARRTRRLVHCLAASILFAGAGICGWACGTPLALPEVGGGVRPERMPTRARVEEIPPLSAFAAIWSKPLRGRLQEETKTTAQASPARPPAPRVARPALVLLGVYGGRVAVFREASGGGKELTVELGERIGDAEVVGIDSDRVTLRRQGVAFDFVIAHPRGEDR